MKIPRILLAAGSSGSGKTLITCGFLQALVNRKMKVASFKCGPDYIDPMFHSQVIGTKSANLDTFFASKNCVRYLMKENAADCQIAVIEGVMGYYDGVGGTSTWASAFDVADVTDTPVILIVNSKGMSLSLLAYIRGFLEFKKNSHIRGVIFNQMSPMLYPRMKSLTEQLGVRVLGYVPVVKDCVIESRHLGLVLPEEVAELKEKLMALAGVLEETLDMDGILELACEAGELIPQQGENRKVSSEPENAQDPRTAQSTLQNTAQSPVTELPEEEEQWRACLIGENAAFGYRVPEPLRIGVTEDEAFCFFYKDNFRLLRDMGAELIPFSPLRDRKLPKQLDGLLLYGGYPELHAKELEDNASMRADLLRALRGGMPCMAECGGFMYLHEEMEDMNGKAHKMVGALEGRAFKTDRLGRFGYIELQKEACPEAGRIPAHEFHYFDSTNCGDAYLAKKPFGNRCWACMHESGRLLAGFPHLYYYGNPEVAKNFLEKCLEYKMSGS